MITGFFGIPEAGVRLARDEHELAALVMLWYDDRSWRHGRAVDGWSGSFGYSDTMLMGAGRWRSRSPARRWLDRMVKAGLIEVMHPGRGGTARSIRISRPSTQRKGLRVIS